jgi:hypothetical protein
LGVSGQRHAPAAFYPRYPLFRRLLHNVQQGITTVAVLPCPPRWPADSVYVTRRLALSKAPPLSFSASVSHLVDQRCHTHASVLIVAGWVRVPASLRPSLCSGSASARHLDSVVLVARDGFDSRLLQGSAPAHTAWRQNLQVAILPSCSVLKTSAMYRPLAVRSLYPLQHTSYQQRSQQRQQQPVDVTSQDHSDSLATQTSPK